MNITVSAPEHRTTFKSFRYSTRVDHVAGRSAVLHGDGKPDLRVVSPKEFKGSLGDWTPEDLLVAAVEVCLMLTFVGIAEKFGVPYTSYESSAEGLLEHDGVSYRFTAVTIRPRITVANADAIEPAKHVIEKAHETCLVARSLRCEVFVEPELVTGD